MMNQAPFPSVYSTMALEPGSEVKARVYQTTNDTGREGRTHWLQIGVPCTGSSITLCGTAEQITGIVEQLSTTLAALQAEARGETPPC